MPNYEHVFICRQDLTSVQAETLAEEFKGTLTENGGKVQFTIDSHSQGQGQSIMIMTGDTSSGLDFKAEI